MPEFPKPVTGNFCWIELQTTDPAAAKKFYADLLGWHLTQMPPGAGMDYTVADIGGKNTAGIMQIPEAAKKMGAPPSWLSYVAVEDVKASTDKAKSLGGTVLMPPSPMGPGTFSVIQDPTGAVFALWYTPQSMGTFVTGEVGALGWNELTTTNLDLAQGFYTKLFGWKADVQPMPAGGGTYVVLKNGDAMIGGMMAAQKEMKDVPSHWGIYFVVADADAGFKKATSTGASVVLPPFDVPGIGRMGFLKDPQGAAFAVAKFLPPTTK